MPIKRTQKLKSSGVGAHLEVTGHEIIVIECEFGDVTIVTGDRPEDADRLATVEIARERAWTVERPYTRDGIRQVTRIVRGKRLEGKLVTLLLADTDEENVANQVFSLVGREFTELLTEGAERLWFYDRRAHKGGRPPGVGSEVKLENRFVVIAHVEDGPAVEEVSGFARGVLRMCGVTKEIVRQARK